MALLRKLRASTLMETLVATVLLVVIFMVASLILNNLLGNTLQGSRRSLEAKLREVDYMQKHGIIAVPYVADYENWTISITRSSQKNQNQLFIVAKNKLNGELIVRQTDEEKTSE